MQPAAPRPIAFVIAATDHGSMILNRHDYQMVGPEQGFGVGYQLLNDSSFDASEVRGALELLSLRRMDFGDGVLALDCGANIGVHTVEWARAMNGWGKVVAFEAQERIFYALAGNIAINNCRNATAANVAVGAKSGVLRIPDLDYDSPASFGSLELRGQPGGGEFIGQSIDYERLSKEVRIIALDDLKLERWDFVKIDVEGMELEVLQGAAESISRHKPIMIIETIKSGAEAVAAFLEPLGYRTWPWGINLLAVHRIDPTASKVSLKRA